MKRGKEEEKGFEKEIEGVVFEETAEKYAMIEKHAGSVAIVKACKALGVNRAGYYKWRRREEERGIVEERKRKERDGESGVEGKRGEFGRKEGTIEKMIKGMQERIRTREFVEKHRRRRGDFTREGKLSFEEVMNFVVGNLGTSLDFEVLNFMRGRESGVTASAICQAREKIQYTAFEEIFKESSKDIGVVHTYRGYRLTAYDGMQGELPRTAELMEKGCVTHRSSYPQFHALAEYDVLNCCYTNAMMHIGIMDEREGAIELLKQHEYEGKEIYVLDRGFPSLQMIQALEKSGKKYVMRVSKSFVREVNEFRESESKDEVIEIKYEEGRRKRKCFEGVELPYTFKLRCVKIELESGETEILVTNLREEEFSREELGEVYNLRWGIETSFLHLKYAVCVEEFMGVKENSIKQEFFASLFKANLLMQFVDAANEIIEQKKNRI